MIYFSCSKKFEFNYWRLSVELNKDESSKLYFFGIMIQKKISAKQENMKTILEVTFLKNYILRVPQPTIQA